MMMTGVDDPQQQQLRMCTVVMDDRRLHVNQIANTVGIFVERVENILHDGFGMSKVLRKIRAAALDT